MKSICKLCQKERELCNGHYLPKSLIRRVPQTHSPHGNAPVIVDVQRNTAIFSNRQPTKYLLCSSCEQLFSKYGEKPVINNCYQNDANFPVRDMLKKTIPSRKNNGKGIYSGLALNTIDPKAFAYFAVSFLWRGSVADWLAPFGDFKDALAPDVTQDFCSYLLNPNSNSYPTSTMVSIHVDFDVPSDTGLIPPKIMNSVPEGLTGRAYDFMIPGMRFIVLVGGNTNDLVSQNLDGCPVSFLEWSYTKSEYYQQVVAVVQRADAKGKLAREEDAS